MGLLNAYHHWQDGRIGQAAWQSAKWAAFERLSHALQNQSEQSEDRLCRSFVGWLSLVEWHNADMACAPTGSPSRKWLEDQASIHNWPTKDLFYDGR